MPRLAVFTFAALRAPMDNPQLSGFIERAQLVSPSASYSHGFIDRASDNDASTETPWGPTSYPKSLH